MLFLEEWSKPLLFLHLVFAVIAFAGAVHCLVRLALLHRRNFPTIHPIRLHARTMLGAYIAAFVLGVLIYPAFRIRVRAEWLDSAHPQVVSLFEMKEHLALLALPVAGFAWWLANQLAPRQAAGIGVVNLYAALGYVVFALGFDAWCGWYVASLRSL